MGTDEKKRDEFARVWCDISSSLSISSLLVDLDNRRPTSSEHDIDYYANDGRVLFDERKQNHHGKT